MKGLKEEVKEYKEEMSSRTDSMESKVKMIEESQTFLSQQYESSRNTVDNILKRDTKREKESAELHGKLKRVEHMLQEERIRRIELAQYLRRDMLELYGIPAKREEDSLQIIEKVARLGKIEKFSPKQIEVAHRVSTKPNAVIIFKFHDRNCRDNSYKQRMKLKALHVKQITSDTNEESVNYPAENVQRRADSFINVNESLTPENKELMKKIREEAKQKGYKYVWTHRGSIKVRKTDDSDLIHIRSSKDLEKII